MENQEKLLESYGKGEIMTDILVTRVRREDILRIGMWKIFFCKVLIDNFVVFCFRRRRIVVQAEGIKLK